MRRRAERAWLKSGKLTVHKEIFEKIKRKVTDLVDNAKTAYYSAKIQASRTCKELYQNFNSITGKTNKSPVPSSYRPNTLPSVFSDYFTSKIATIRSNFPSSTSTSESDASVYRGNLLEAFVPVTEESVRSILKNTVPKSCELDPIPTHLLYDNLDILLPTITKLINESLASGTVPEELKTAVVKPLLKKPSLNKEELKNYRPISNLPFLSKLLEKVVLQQLLTHLDANDLCNVFQSAYRAGHSTETALLRVVNDLLLAMDQNKVSLLLLLDLSAAFDTVDHQILLSRLQNTFGIQSTALQWFRSYLLDRKQFVSVGNVSSSVSHLQFGVPQGSVLGPVLFVLYTTPLSQLIQSHSVNHQLFADDTQLQQSSSPTSIHTLSSNLQSCTADIKTWMNTNQLKLNDDKTEALLFSPPNLPFSCALPTGVSVGSHIIPFSDNARNLGFVMDSQLSMRQHVTRVCQIAFFELRRISSIRRYLSQDATKTIVTSCILSRLDYCNSLLMGTDKIVTQRMQIVQNYAARLILGASRRSPATPLLRTLHWLPISERIKYKVACICYNIITETAPSYLTELLPKYSNLSKLRSASDTRMFQDGHYQRKTHGYRSLQYYGPHFWKTLPYDLRHSQTITSFKSKLKTHLFNQYYT